MLPLWFIFALATALCATAIPLIQEKFKAEPMALAFWIRIVITVLILPFCLYYGMPDRWEFYAYTAATALLYLLSDLQYFRAVPQIGSGLVTRLLPAAVVVTFFLWFVVDPDLINDYTDTPWRMTAILAVMAFFVFCATRVKKCSTSWSGAKQIWFVLVAACIGPIITKSGLNHATMEQGVCAYMLVQSLCMLGILPVMYRYKKLPLRGLLTERQSIHTGLILGVVMAITTFMKIKAFQLVDNPGFVSMVIFTDALWVLLVYKLIGRKETGNVLAGLGIVLSAILIILIKNS